MSLFFRNPDGQALLLLAALTFLFLLPAATMQGVYFYGDANDYFARLAYSAERLRGGQAALWNPYLSFGGPHLADPAALATYVPALALFVILPAPFAYNYTVILHLYLAASGMYLLARAWQQTRGAALVAAIVFGCGGFVVAHLQHLNIVVGAAWLPWIFLCLEKYFATRRISFLAWGSIVLALQMMGGHTQTVLYGGAAWGAYCAVYFVRGWRGGRGRTVAYQIVGIALMLVGAFGLAAIFILPFVELLNFTARSERITYEYATSFSLEPLRLVEFVFPYAFGGNPGSVERGAGSLIEMTAYLGILPLALGIVALWRRKWRVYFLAGMALVTLLLALGKFTPLYEIVYRLPAFGAVRAPARFLELVAFAVALLAGFGLDEIRRGVRKSQRVVVLILLTSVLLFQIALWFAARAGVNLSETFANAGANPALLVAIFFTLAAFGIFLLWWRNLFSERARVGLTLVFVFADLIFFGWNFRYNFVAPLDVYAPGKNALALQRAPNALTYYWGLGETKLASYLQTGELEKYADASRAGLRQSLPLLWRVRSMQGYGTEPPVYQDLMQALEKDKTFDEKSAQLAARLGNTHVLTKQDLANAALTRVQNNAQVALYENTLSSGIARAYPAWDVVEAINPQAAVTALAEDSSRVRLQANLMMYQKPENAEGRAEMKSDEPERVTVRVVSSQQGWLVLNDSYYPGWRATVDNNPAAIVRANGLARAVPISQGAQLVEFVYDPLSVKIGAFVSLVTLLVVAGVLLVEWNRSRAHLALPAP